MLDKIKLYMLIRYKLNKICFTISFLHIAQYYELLCHCFLTLWIILFHDDHSSDFGILKKVNTLPICGKIKRTSKVIISSMKLMSDHSRSAFIYQRSIRRVAWI